MIIIFCGIPGSGKTTIAKLLSEILTNFGRVKLIVSDEISGKVYKRILTQLTESLSEMDYIVVDATFYKKRWREMVEAIAGRDTILLCYLCCPLDTCLARNKERNPSLPEKVIHIISKEMERPLKPDISINTEKIPPQTAACEIALRVHSI